MRRQILFGFFILVSFCFSSFIVQAGQVIQGDINPGIYGEVITCAFPNTIVLDGKLDELAWKHAPWHITEAEDATVPATNNKDASVKFAVVADNKFLYMAAEITDDKVQSGENITCDVWNDDSIEAYIDGANEKAGAYDINDAQITVGADVIGEVPDAKVTAGLLGGCVGITQGPATGTIATGKETATGWIVEIAIPLKNQGWDIKPKNGSRIGFNMQYNDDDDGAGRDHKLIWCAQEVKQGEGSWNNPSLFAELQFVEAVLAVSPHSKTATTWASIKSADL